MRKRLKDVLLGINQQRRGISRRVNVVLLGLLQLVGGIILYNADYTRGTPLIIQDSGVISMPVFAVLMVIAGAFTLLFCVFGFKYLDTIQMILLTTPFIAYIMATVYGAVMGLQSGQGAFIYVIFYLIAMNGVWGSD